MIEPKEIELDGKVFIISKFNYEDGREIVTQYPISAIPKLGDYQRNKEIVRLMMSYVAIPQRDKIPLRLITPELINNHIPSWEIGVKLEIALMEYNCSFFQNGQALNFLEQLGQDLPEWIIKISTPFLQRLSSNESQRLKS